MNEMLAASNEKAMKHTEKKRNAKRCIYQSIKKVNEQFGKKVNEDVNGNRKLFWTNVTGGKVENCSKIKDGNGRLAQREDEVPRILKEYF